MADVRQKTVIAITTVVLLAGVLLGEAGAHGVSGKDAVFLQSIRAPPSVR